MYERGSIEDHFAFRPEFLEKLKADPDEALKLIGITPTEAIKMALENLDGEALEQTIKLAKEVADQKPQMIWP